MLVADKCREFGGVLFPPPRVAGPQLGLGAGSRVNVDFAEQRHDLRLELAAGAFQAFVPDAPVGGVSGWFRLGHPRHWRQLRLNRPNRPGFRCLRPFAAVRSLPLPLPLVFIMSMLLSGRRMSPATLRSA